MAKKFVKLTAGGGGSSFAITNPLNGGTLEGVKQSDGLTTYQYEFSGGTPKIVVAKSGDKMFSSTRLADVSGRADDDTLLNITFSWGSVTIDSSGLIKVYSGDGANLAAEFIVSVEVQFSDGIGWTEVDTFTAKGYGYECFVKGTRISLADGTTKAVEDITYDDELLVWDFYNGDYATAKPSWIMIPMVAAQYKLVTLSNGTQIRLVGDGDKCHRLFNVTKQKMLYANECVGDEVFTESGIATVVSCVTINETVNYYNLTTEEHYCCFAEGVLTGSRLNNMYHISDMKYDSDERLISDEEVAERWAVREATRLKI